MIRPVLGYEIGIHQEKEWNASGRAGAPRWGGWSPWGTESVSGTANSSTIKIGILVLSIYDPATKRLVWIGAAQRAIDPSRSRTRTRKI